MEKRPSSRRYQSISRRRRRFFVITNVINGHRNAHRVDTRYRDTLTTAAVVV